MAWGEQQLPLLIPTALSVVWHDPHTSSTPPSCPQQGCDTTGSSIFSVGSPSAHHILGLLGIL